MVESIVERVGGKREVEVSGGLSGEDVRVLVGILDLKRVLEEEKSLEKGEEVVLKLEEVIEWWVECKWDDEGYKRVWDKGVEG